MSFKPVQRLMNSDYSPLKRLGNYLAYLWQYRSVFTVTVKNNLKGRFKNTILGYFWHLLNPLTQIVIFYLIFTVIFGRDIPNYWIYISCGMFAFSFFSSCTIGGSKVIINNSRMINKMAMARELLVFSNVTVALVNLLISYCLLLILIILLGPGLSINVIIMPIIIVLFAVFCTGLALMLSSLSVYVRDLANAVTILVGCMMFAVPIVYLASQRATPAMEAFWSINPLYYYVECVHSCMYYNEMPDTFQMLMCLLFAVLFFTSGLYVFKKLEGGFAERL